MASPAEVTTWRSADLLRASIVFFVTFVALLFLWVTRSIILITILSVLFAVTLSHGVDILERWHCRRPLGTLVLLLLVFGVLTGVGFLVAPSLASQTRDLMQQFPAAIEKIERQIRREPLARAALSAAAQPQQQQQQQQGQPKQQGEARRGGLMSVLGAQGGRFVQMLFPFLNNPLAAIAGIVVVIFLVAYMATDPKLYRDGLVAIVPPQRRAKADALLDELAELLRRWLVARLAAMVIVGLATAGALALLGIPAAGALGVVAGLLEFIPFVGPIAAAVPAVAIALAVSPTKALPVILLFVVLQQLEGNLLTPLLMQNRLDVPPVITIVAVSALGIVFGVLGMLIAEPLSAAVLLSVRRLYVERMEDAA
jgi:predicted PurR-regulated permease PerM